MPPRRKAAQAGAAVAEDASQPANTRPVRSSTRQKTAKSENDAAAPEPTSASTKKRKTTDAAAKGKPATKRARASKSAKTNDDDEDVVVPGPSKGTKSRAKTGSSSTLIANSSTTLAAKSQPSLPPEAAEPKPENVQELFNKYADEDDKDAISAGGLETLYGDANIALDGAMPWIMAWRFNAEEMLRFTREEWKRGMEGLSVDSLKGLKIALSELDALLIFGKPAAKRAKGKSTDAYSQCAANPEAAFTDLYTFCFSLGKKGQARVIEMEIAVAFWSVLLAPKYPIMSEILEYIGEKGTYKAATKDQWSMTHEFCRTVKPNLEGYDSDGAWPTLLDDFVTWKKAKLEAAL